MGQAPSAFPDGLGDADVARNRWGAHASLVPLLVLGTLIVAALSGVLAGARTPERAIDVAAARLAIQVPERMRNGVFFEMRIRVDAKQAIAEPVIAIPPALWTDMTINTMIPAAADERYEDGAFRFAYGALKPGDTLVVKFDGQINPPLTRGTAGEVALYDGKRRLGALPVDIKVLP